ncbi:MAG TPA: hypothetical protein VM571_01290, partial [Noviherbaspirillum sp.]|nr:hypothetical protein [Noviherbaspirillum sp.]
MTKIRNGSPHPDFPPQEPEPNSDALPERQVTRKNGVGDLRTAAKLQAASESDNPLSDIPANRTREGGVMRGHLNQMMSKLQTSHLKDFSPEEQEAINASTLSPSLAHSMCGALRKANIPINQATISDIERFNENNLTAPMQRMTQGRISVVSKATYGDFIGVFRMPGKGILSKGLNLIEKSSSPCRDKATYLLDGALRFGVIPYTAFAVQKNEFGKLEAGVVMEFVEGSTPAVSREKVDITETDVGKELLENKSALLKDERFMRIQCKLLGVDKIIYSDNHVYAYGNRSSAKLDGSIAKRELTKLQILDYLSGQVDRHSKNYI